MPERSGDPPPPPATPAAAEGAKVLLGRYELGRFLGRGGSAKVYLARDLRSGEAVAVKVFSKVRPSSSRGGHAAASEIASGVRREIAAMRRLRHPHVLRLHAVLATRSRIYLVLDLARGGELFARLADGGRLPEPAARRIFRQLVSAVAYCHSRGVFHRDLKPENLLLDDAGDLRVADFGLAALLPDQIHPDGKLHTLCGTPAYVAPEILLKKGYSGAPVDVWSCGVILFVLVAGYLPFNDANLMNMYRKIYRGQFRCPSWTSPGLRRLLGRILDPNPETRITVDGIFHDPWFCKGLAEEERRALMRLQDDDDNEMVKSDGEDHEDRAMNAFDIISFSSGLDLSGLFDDTGQEPVRFVCPEPTQSVLAKVEEVGVREGFGVRRKGKLRDRVAVEGQNGNLMAEVRVHRLNEELTVVEVKRGASEGGFWKEKLIPALRGPRGLLDSRAEDRLEPVQ